MDTPNDSPLFPDAHSMPPAGRTFINAQLWFDDHNGYRVIFCRHEILYRVALNDNVLLAVIAVTLRQSELATQVEIATAFGHSVASQRRWETRFLKDGHEGLQPRRRCGRPAKIGRGQLAFVRQWFEEGASNREIARRLAVGEATVRRLLHQQGLRRPTQSAPQLPFDPPDVVSLNLSGPTSPAADTVAAPVDTDSLPSSSPPANPPAPEPALPTAPPTQAESALTPLTTPTADVPTPVVSTEPASQTPPMPWTMDRDPSNRWMDRALARLGVLDDAAPLFEDATQLPRAGVLLAVPVVVDHGGLEVFQRLYRSLGPAFYGLRTTVLSLVLLALLRVKRPENLKEYSPEQLGRLVGLDRMAEVKTLRRKLSTLASQGKGRQLMDELARARLEQDEDRLAFLYIDGHVREYSGHEPLAKAKKAQRAVATTAATDTWLHDAAGEPLLVVLHEMNEGLTQVLEALVKEVLPLVPAGQRLTLVFDRGGWSPKLFKRLIALGVDLITYRKGHRSQLPRRRFVAHRVQVAGQEKTYWLCDQRRVRVGRLRSRRRKRRASDGPQYLWLRQVTVLREDGQQTTVVTNRQDLAAVEVVVRQFARWRQENYFKYMAAEFALDALAEYGVDDVAELVTRPNPERKKVTKQRQKVRVEVARLRAELGELLENNPESQRPTVRGFKVAHAQLRLRLEGAEGRERRLTEKLSALPQRVPATDLKTLKKEKQLLVDAIKIMAYQVETELLSRLGPHYARGDDEGRTLLHAAFQTSGDLCVTETELQITLAAQSSPHRTAALAKLCRDLDAQGVNFPGSALRLRLAVEGAEPLIE